LANHVNPKKIGNHTFYGSSSKGGRKENLQYAFSKDPYFQNASLTSEENQEQGEDRGIWGTLQGVFGGKEGEEGMGGLGKLLGVGAAGALLYGIYENFGFLALIIVALLGGMLMSNSGVGSMFGGDASAQMPAVPGEAVIVPTGYTPPQPQQPAPARAIEIDIRGPENTPSSAKQGRGTARGH
jgi:hypothetical protein